MADETKSRIQRAFPATGREMFESEKPAVAEFKKKYGTLSDADKPFEGVLFMHSDGTSEYYPPDEMHKIPRACISPLSTRPVLYTDTIQGGNQAMRDDLWAVSTDELNQTAKDALDAARYRWLCQAATKLDSDWAIVKIAPDGKSMEPVIIKFAIDREIDAAIEAEKEQANGK